MGKLGRIARRTFLIGSAAIAGGVAFGYYKYKAPVANPLLGDLRPGQAALTPYVLIDETAVTPKRRRSELDHRFAEKGFAER